MIMMMMMMSVLVLNEVVLGHLVTVEIASEVHVRYEFHRRLLFIFNPHQPLVHFVLNVGLSSVTLDWRCAASYTVNSIYCLLFTEYLPVNYRN